MQWPSTLHVSPPLPYCSCQGSSAALGIPWPRTSLGFAIPCKSQSGGLRKEVMILISTSTSEVRVLPRGLEWLKRDGRFGEAVSHNLTSGIGERPVGRKARSLESHGGPWAQTAPAAAASTLASDYTPHLREPVTPLVGFSFLLVTDMRKQSSIRFGVIAFQL